MRTPPADITSESIQRTLLEGWQLALDTIEYVPEGGGSHHWRVSDEGGRLHFVTVDDLDNKPWIAGSRGAVFEGLRGAYRTAESLQVSAGLEFVVAPTPTTDGDVLRRLDERHTVSVFPHLDGRSYPFDSEIGDALRDKTLAMIIALHEATPVVRSRAPVHILDFSGRSHLEAFLADPDRDWTGGPFSEPAARLMAARADGITALIATFDYLSAVTLPARRETVITHGEPHPGNVMSVGGREVLVDWDTVGLAPAERDLTLIASDTGDEVERYERATGREVDPTVMMLYRLRWFLDDLASAARLFLNPHLDTDDTRRWREGLGFSLDLVPVWLDRLA